MLAAATVEENQALTGLMLTNKHPRLAVPLLQTHEPARLTVHPYHRTKRCTLPSAWEEEKASMSGRGSRVGKFPLFLFLKQKLRFLEAQDWL